MLVDWPILIIKKKNYVANWIPKKYEGVNHVYLFLINYYYNLRAMSNLQNNII